MEIIKEVLLEANQKYSKKQKLQLAEHTKH
ncbi:uncharacterized protein METZ01_LOCUS36029 [marine metagenome]|uniref:Uncharacterized protein n=1 Tax=marine metagenome TaxID=408172 RepID=A0A381QUX2_9ZZZZ